MTVGTNFQPHMASNKPPMMRNFPMNFFTSPNQHQLTDTKGLLNGPGQNNCFLNCAVQVSPNIISCFHYQQRIVQFNVGVKRLSVFINAMRHQKFHEFPKANL
jgi:hypothetical protein